MRLRDGDVVRYLRTRAYELEVTEAAGLPGGPRSTPAELERIARDALLRAAHIIDAAANGEKLRFKKGGR